jgi:Tfp pilus assembly protein PilO
MITLKLSSREKKIAFLSAGILGISMFYNLAFEPMVNHTRDTRREITVLNNELLKITRIMELKEPVETTYQEHQATIVSGGSQEEEIANLLMEIESLSRPLFIEIISIKPLPVIDKGFYKRYLIQVEAEGNILDISNFLYSIENSASLMKIKRIQLNARSSDIVRVSFQTSRILVTK